MRKIRYYLKLSCMMLLMSMAAFGLVMPGQMETRKRHKDKEITIEWVLTREEETEVEASETTDTK